MILKGIVIEDFINYKVPSLYIAFPRCNFKCDLDAGEKVCQNSDLAQSPDIDISIKKIVEGFINNDITKAIVFGGLEPFESYEDILDLIREFRKHTEANIIIYTGFNEDELDLTELKVYPNIIIKFGRFIPNDESKFDEVLGVELKSKNQYAKKIS